MRPKELDCILLKDGREGTIMDDFHDGNYRVDLSPVPDDCDLQIVNIEEIEKITYVSED